jgi:hypothetical protein
MYLAVIGVVFGAFNLAPIFDFPIGSFSIRGNDLFIWPLVGYTFVQFCRRDKFEFYRKHPLFRVYGLYFALILFMMFNSLFLMSSTYTNILLLSRNLIPFMGIFFITLAVVKSRHQVKAAVAVMVIYSILLGVVTIIQSLSGPTPILNDDSNTGFYVTVGWSQHVSSIEGITRVNLPSIAMIIASAVYFFVDNLWLKHRRNMVLLPLFLSAIIINYSRAQIIGVIITFLLILFMYSAAKTRRSKWIVYVLVLTAGLYVVTNVWESFGFKEFGIAVIQRLFSSTQDIQQQEGSWLTRLVEVTNAFRIWRSNFWYIVFGLGIEPIKILAGITSTGIYVHIGYYDVLLRAGILGSVIMFVFFITLLWYTFKQRSRGTNPDTQILYITTFGYHVVLLVFFFSSNEYFNGCYMAVLGVMLGLSMVSQKLDNDDKAKEESVKAGSSLKNCG